MVFASRAIGTRYRLVGVALLAVALLAMTLLPAWTTPARAAGPCDPGSNPVACENSKPGNPQSDWMLEGSYGNIVGFGTAASVQPSETQSFKVSTPASSWHVEIYRLGWYQ